MTLVSDIINYAFRQGNLTAVGKEPTETQKAEALYYLNTIVASSIGNEVSDPLQSFPVGRKDISRPSGYPWWDTVPDNNWFVPKDTRIMLNLDQGIPGLWLHPDPNDGTRFAVIDVAQNLSQLPVTVYGNGRRIENQVSILLDQDGYDAEWLYRADLGNWIKSVPLFPEDEFPFPKDFDDYFITMLAVRLNPSYGVALDPQSAEILRNGRSQLRARYSQIIPQRAEFALIRPAKLAADRDRWGNTYWLYQPNSMFDKGWPW